MKQWQHDKRWSDRFLPQIKSILGAYLIAEPPIEEDAERNTDLMVLRLDAVRVACRVRKHCYLARYGDEFTIRAGRPSGAVTELTKIITGWGDYFFYGFCDEAERSLEKWLLGDLNAFRIWHSRCLAGNHGRPPGTPQMNADHSSTFRAFSPRSIPGFLIASSDGSQTDLFGSAA